MSQSGKKMRAALPEAASERKSGRAVFDEGRTVWEWQTATGVFERHVSDEQMSRLEASDLCLVEQDAPVKDAGNAIYGSRSFGRNDVAARNRAPLRRSSASMSAFRQLWRRLVPVG
mgnify:CR=1 FL=1